MTMQLRLVHTTGFTYDGGVVASYNEARLTPVTTPDQVVLHSRVDISPSPWTFRYWDYWGTQVTAFEIHDLHDELTVTATSTVEVDRAPVTPSGLSWEEVAGSAAIDEHHELLTLSPRVDPGPELTQRARVLAANSAGPSAFGQALCELVHAEVEYVTGSTHVHTSAADAWTKRQGVCQDLAHLCLGALRSVGVPARYVSGYLHPHVDPRPNETVSGESHAWIEWWDGHWVGFDPTNQVQPDDRYVVVATGRDYGDVAPLGGIFSGGETSSMFVRVDVTRLR